ncbi:MAG: hypothetical protein LBQ52_01730 [Helicobacteraceae bacterium]|jgi:hypothetical protein|nr:hypothetical protein [Helicobacteraceae bacterium]
MSFSDTRIAYRRARFAYALASLRSEARLCRESIENRLQRATSDEELKELLSAAEMLRETDRFVRNLNATKDPQFDLSTQFSYRLES